MLVMHNASTPTVAQQDPAQLGGHGVCGKRVACDQSVMPTTRKMPSTRIFQGS